MPKKNPHAVALGRRAKGKPKTMTPAAVKARSAGGKATAAKRRAIAMKIAQDLHAQDLEPLQPGPVVPYEDDED